MTKSKFFKSSIMLVIMIAVCMVGAVTAYAEDSTDNGYENGTYENGVYTPTKPPTQDEQPIQEPLLGSLIQRTVEILTRAETSGNPLHGATFAVYRFTDNQRVGEITTDIDGGAAISLNAGDYYLCNNSVQFGFLRELSRIFFTVADGNISIEVTLQRDPDVPNAEVDNVTLPQTGELLPAMNYVFGTLFMAVALLCGAVLFYQHRHDKQPKYKRNKSLRKGARAYA